MSIPKIDPYPPAPTPEDDEATFDEKAYEHAASLETRRVQMNEVATYVNTRASDANNRAVAAAASATASANSAARADEWANKAPGSVVATGKYSARHYSDLSDKFANAPEDVEVEPGKFSALHWQEKAKKIANVHATTVATDPLPTVLATNVQEALRDLAYQSDQLRIAKNQLKYGDGPYPVLDFQFAGAKMLDPRIDFTRASKDWDWDGREYGIDEPVLTDEGLWVSGARTNLVSNSETPTGVSVVGGAVTTKPYWGGVLGVFTPQAWAGVNRYFDYGVITTEDTASVQFLLEKMPKVAMMAEIYWGHSAALFRLVVETTGEYFLERGSSSHLKITEVDGGLLHVKIESFSKAEGDTTPRVRFRMYRSEEDADGVNSVVFGRVMWESGVVCTPYIPTKGSQVTVAATKATLNTDSSFFSKDAGSAKVDFSTLSVDGGDRTALCFISGSNFATQLRFYVNSAGRARIRARADNVDLAHTDNSFSGQASMAASWGAGSNIVLNGEVLRSDPNPFVLDVSGVNLGDFHSGTGYLKGFLRGVSIYTQTLSADQLQELTT